MNQLSLGCECQKINGVARDLNSEHDMHLVCCCNDCQQFARVLGQEKKVLDKFGGTEVIQITPAQISIDKGLENLKCLKLSTKGIIRWYCGHCHTPVANTISARLPFVGLHQAFVKDKAAVNTYMGPVIQYIQTRHALEIPTGIKTAKGFPLNLLVKTFYRLILATMKRKNRPNPFFTQSGEPISAPQTMTENGRLPLDT